MNFNPGLLLLLFVMLTSCMTPKPVAYHCPRIILPADPVPPTRKLTLKSQPNDVMKAWVATAYLYQGWNKTVRKQVESSK
jgi:hypothetical protein